MNLISERILLTLWVGGMWTIGYMVAPVLFKMLERQVAGNVAGQLFTIMSYIGLLCCILLLTSMIYRLGFANLLQWRVLVLVGMLAIILIGQFVLQPMMVELKAAGLTGDIKAQFGRLHGVSSLLFMINSLAGLVLVVFGLSGKTS